MTSEEQDPAVTAGSAASRVIPITIETEMKSSYINYAMSVIIGRAIPDVRDGLKPVHRRSLFSMWEMGNTSDKPTRKSARVVGDVMGKYHPHGDAAIYDTIVKMAQPFSYRYPLIEGQGNFGSIDGDAPAAMRYTEVRLEPLAEELLKDLEKETVAFVPNFDESLSEPTVLPAKIPNLLVNGSSGIAVGMATNMPPHNLGEVCDAVCRCLEQPDTSVDDLLRILPGPDFPTGGVIMGREGIRAAYETGQGKVVVRGVAEIEERGTRGDRIVISEIPFQVNKARLIEHIAGLVKEKKIEGIADIRDESDKEGLRVVIDLKKGIIPGIILNQLYKHTALESTFGIINLAIVDNQPRYLPLGELINHFIMHRVEVIRRRSEFDRKKAEERVHILKGLLLALSRIDEVIAAIRASDTAETAKNTLISRFGLDEVQAQAILQMQLRRLAALEQKKILDEKNELEQEIARLSELLSDEKNIRAEIRNELIGVKEKYGDSRRTQISASAISIDKEDMIEDKKVLVSLTSLNYIKRMDIDTYRQQRRGGKGIIGMSTKEEDYVENVFIASTHDYLLCFTSNGRVYWLKVYEIPEGSRTSRGKAIVNLLNLRDEVVTAIIPVREFSPELFLLFATRLGQIIKIPLKEFSFPRSVGTNAIRLRENDQLVDVIMTDGSKEIILTSSFGQSLRFHEDTVRTVGRNTQGVRGMKLRGGDTVVAVTLLEKDHLLTISDAGFGKRTEFDDFRGHGRGTMGVRNIQLGRNAVVIASCAVSHTDEIIVMTASGIVMRTAVSEIRVIGRGTKGVRIMRLDESDRVVGIAVVPPDIDNGEAGEPDTGGPGEAERGQPDTGGPGEAERGQPDTGGPGEAKRGQPEQPGS